MSRRGPSKAVRQRVFDRDHYQCHYCGLIATTLDHVIPSSKGGTHHVTNLVASCHDCNSRRGSVLHRVRCGDKLEIFTRIIQRPTPNYPRGRSRIIGSGPHDTRAEAECALVRRIMERRYE